MSSTSTAAERKVVAALRREAPGIAGWSRFKRKKSRMGPQAANAFLLGVMFDRSVPYERAWDAAEWMCESIGDPEDVTAIWRSLQGMEPKRLRGFLRYGYGGQAFHRHYKTFARLLPEAASHILVTYDGDPRRIWNNERNVERVRERLDAIPAIGPALARMAVLMLARKYGRLGGRKAQRHIDIKPDVHVQRVFRRTGLTPRRATPAQQIATARRLAPDFPGSLDAPAWKIGRQWCRPQKPACGECPISRVCPRLGIRH